jgi:hypothetical protein
VRARGKTTRSSLDDDLAMAGKPREQLIHAASSSTFISRSIAFDVREAGDGVPGSGSILRVHTHQPVTDPV